MRKIKLNVSYQAPVEYNTGQTVEFLFSATLYGKPKFADNVDACIQADVGCYQVKGPRATVCEGTTWEAFLDHIQADRARAYAYIPKDKKEGYKYAYIMNKREYVAFVNEFSIIDSSSKACDLAREQDVSPVKDIRRLGRKFKAIQEYLDNKIALSKLK